MVITVDADSPMRVKRAVDAEWESFAAASDFSEKLTTVYLQTNTFVSLFSGSHRGRSGIVVLVSIIPEGFVRPDSIFIIWDWRVYPSTADLATKGIPDTDYDEFICWLKDYGYEPTSDVVAGIITQLQSLINIAREDAGLAVKASDRVETG